MILFRNYPHPLYLVWYTKRKASHLLTLFIINSRSMKKLTAIITLSVLTLMPLAAGAVNIPRNTVPQGITSFQGFLNLFDKVISWLFTILMVFAVLMIVYAAFSYLTSGGDEEKVGAAHKRIMYAVVAIAVAFLAQGVSFVVAELLGQPVQ